MAQTDSGLAREIHREIGGGAKEIGARLVEVRGGASLEEMEIGILSTKAAAPKLESNMV